MGKTISTLAIVDLLGAESVGGAEHDELVRSAPPHTHSEIPLPLAMTLAAPISATGGGNTVLRAKPLALHLSAPIAQIICTKE